MNNYLPEINYSRKDYYSNDYLDKSGKRLYKFSYPNATFILRSSSLGLFHVSRPAHSSSMIVPFRMATVLGSAGR